MSAGTRGQDGLDQIFGCTGPVSAAVSSSKRAAPQAHRRFVRSDVAAAVRTPRQVSLESLAHLGGGIAVEIIEDEVRQLPARHDGPQKAEDCRSCGTRNRVPTARP